MADLISRQAAIDAINRAMTKEAARWSVKELPSEEPEVIRCKDCKCYADVFDIGRIFEKGSCGRLYIDTVKPDDFCSWAERRSDD